MEDDFAHWSCELGNRLVEAQRGVATRQLRQILARSMRGHVAMRLEVWRAASALAARTMLLNMDAAQHFAGFQRQQEAWAAHSNRAVGTRQLRQLMVRFMREDVALRLAMWRGAAMVSMYARCEAMQHEKGGMRMAAWSAGVVSALPLAATWLLGSGRGVLV